MDQGVQVLAQRGFQALVPGSDDHLDLLTTLRDSQIDRRCFGLRNPHFDLVRLQGLRKSGARIL
jgi:hypothetical protein